MKLDEQFDLAPRCAGCGCYGRRGFSSAMHPDGLSSPGYIQARKLCDMAFAAVRQTPLEKLKKGSLDEVKAVASGYGEQGAA